ncbi:O-antigen ligase family protein [Fusobacterium mortiferum]|uniref:O-antigen ligase family protein n=1 Tax=Fusobacterium mortiferum TaxID=850 RepID=UPI000E4CECB0|nr:O-antigen ligase family protein [Fusobacterium mortiferum]RHF67234.1 O-antigen ligase family protein [Fusobacterium mortiferum]
MFKINQNIYNKIGELGVYIYTLSLFISKFGVNIGLGFLVLAFLLYLWDRRKIKLTTEEKYILAILILLPIFSLFSTGGSYSFQRALEKSYRYLPIFFIPLFITSERIIKIILSLFSLSIFISFINGIFFYKKLKWNFNARLISFSSHPLDEAHILAMGSLFLLVLLIYTLKFKKQKELPIYLLAFILALIALVMTQGRGAWLGFLSGLFVVVFLLMKNKKLFIVGVILVGVLGVGAVTSEELENNRYIKRFESIQNLEDTSNKIRLFMWESSIDMFKNNFPFGVGRDNAGKYALEYMEKNHKYDEMKNKWAKAHLKEIAGSGNLHSMYFTSLAEEGILSFPFIGMFLFILYRQFRYCIARERDLNFYLVVGTMGMLVAFLVGGLTENVWREMWKSNVLVFSLGLYLSRVKSEN